MSEHRVESSHDRDMQIAVCREYRAAKQRKKRQYYNDCVNTIIEAYSYVRLSVWKTIEMLTDTQFDKTRPTDNELLEYFRSMSEPQPTHDFNVRYESIALDFLNQYDMGICENKDSLEYKLINDDVRVHEVERAI